MNRGIKMLRRHIFLPVIFVIAVSFLFTNSAKAQLVKDGLVAYWSLDENAVTGKDVIDIIGGNDGSIVGNPKLVEGKIGSALEFSGASDKIDIPGTDALAFNGKSELSAAAWINVMGHSGSCCDPIVAQRDVSSWALRYDNRNIGAELELIVSPGWVGDGDGFGIEVPDQEEWHYLVGVCTGDQLLMYLDGELGENGEIAFPGAISSGGTATTIGGASDGYFMGIIDEVVIYDKALSEAEIKQNFQAQGLSGAVDTLGKLAVCWGQIKK